MVTIGFEVLKMVCGLIKAVHGSGEGREGGGGLIQVLETGGAEQGLCSAHARLPVRVRTRAEHQRSLTQALL